MTGRVNKEAKAMDHLPTEDPELEEFAIAEDELIDAYVRDELSEDERKLIEKGFRNSPHLGERVHFARMLAKAASPVPELQTSGSVIEPKASVVKPVPKHLRTSGWKSFFGASVVPQPVFRMAIGIFIVLVLTSGVVLFAGWMKIRNESKRIAAEQAAIEQQRNELNRQSAEQRETIAQISAELKNAQSRNSKAEQMIEDLLRKQRESERVVPQKATPTLASITLLPYGGSRGDGANPQELARPPSGSVVVLQLVLESPGYLRYSALLRNETGFEIQKNGLKSHRTRSGNTLSLKLPASDLSPGNYLIQLSGVASNGAVEPASNYQFRVSN